MCDNFQCTKEGRGKVRKPKFKTLVTPDSPLPTSWEELQSEKSHMGGWVLWLLGPNSTADGQSKSPDPFKDKNLLEVCDQVEHEARLWAEAIIDVDDPSPQDIEAYDEKVETLANDIDPFEVLKTTMQREWMSAGKLPSRTFSYTIWVRKLPLLDGCATVTHLT